MAHLRVRAHVPLQHFRWDGERCDVGGGVHLERRRSLPDLRGQEKELARSAQARLVDEVTHWLNFEVIDGASRSTAEITNLFLLALWIVKATKTEVSFRFEFGEIESHEFNSVVCVLDRFQWVPGVTDDRFDDADLDQATAYFQTLLGIADSGRLNHALLLTLAACWSNRWQVALMLAAAAAETLLTYSTGPGLTRRLALAYACLVAQAPQDRDAAFREFIACYVVRSDIVHGRGMRIPETDRLAELVRWQHLMRSAWRAILETPTLIAVFEGTDAQREAWMKAATSSYSPPTSQQVETARDGRE